MADVTLPRYVVSGAVPRQSEPYTYEHIQREFERIQVAWAALAGAVEKNLGSGGSSGSGSSSDDDFVEGPDSSVNGEVALFDGTTGKLIKRGSGTGVAKLTAGVLAAGSVALASEVTGKLPLANLDLDGDSSHVLHSDGTESAVAAADISGLEHDLLSATHSDTDAASPSIGAIVVGQPSEVTKPETFWFDGGVIPGVVSTEDVGAAGVWADGLAAPAIGLTISASGAVWQKLTPAEAGAVPTYDGSQVVWQVPSATAVIWTATAVRTSNLAVPTATSTTIAWNSTAEDTGPYWSAATPSRLTVPATAAGLYLVLAQVTWASSSLSGGPTVLLKVNGAEVARSVFFTASGVAQAQQVAYLRRLDAADYVEVAVLDGSFPRTISGGAIRTWCSVARIG